MLDENDAKHHDHQLREHEWEGYFVVHCIRAGVVNCVNVLSNTISLRNKLNIIIYTQCPCEIKKGSSFKEIYLMSLEDEDEKNCHRFAVKRPVGLKT